MLPDSGFVQTDLWNGDRPAQSRVALEAEVLLLRQQINVLRRTRSRGLPSSRLTSDIGRYLRTVSKNVLAIVRPDTVIRWHRAGFRLYWRWKSRHRYGRPAVRLEIRRLIREMSTANPLWGAPRIHGELLKLGRRLSKPAWPSIWRGGGLLRRRVGTPSFVTMLTVSPRWTFLSRRQSHSGCSMDC